MTMKLQISSFVLWYIWKLGGNRIRNQMKIIFRIIHPHQFIVEYHMISIFFCSRLTRSLKIQSRKIDENKSEDFIFCARSHSPCAVVHFLTSPMMMISDHIWCDVSNLFARGWENWLEFRYFQIFYEISTRLLKSFEFEQTGMIK